MDFLSVKNKYYLLTGVANKKSLAYFVAKELVEQGAELLLSVQNEDILPKVQSLFPNAKIFCCDVGDEVQVESLGMQVASYLGDKRLAGLLHSLAFANFSDGVKPFLETSWKDFSEASHISMYSLISLSRALKPCLENDASIVTISISSTRATSYGYLGPIKACLEASVPFLAKSFSEFSKIRVNAVCAGPLKTSASAGIPGYINNYLYAEKLTLRGEALTTPEVANTVLFLLSERSSGINGESLVIDAGINSNYFDQDVVKKVMT